MKANEGVGGDESEIETETTEVTESSLPITELTQAQLESSVLEGALDIKSLSNVVSDRVEIRLADVTIPGKTDGEAISYEEALTYLLGVSTKKKHLVPATGLGGALDAINIFDTSIDVGAYAGTDAEKIEAIAADVSEEAISDVIDVKINNKSVSDADLSFVAGSVVLVIDQPQNFIPGTYTISVDYTNPVTGEVTSFTQDFTWGVLTMNTAQDSYKKGETAKIEMGILDNTGMPSCEFAPQLKMKKMNNEE